MLTINQDVELFKNFALKHKGFNTFYFGDEWEADTSIKIVYPFMNAILQSSSIKKGIVSRTYLIIVSDLVNKDESNETHVLSDTERMCFDLPSYLRKVANTKQLGAFNFDADISLTDFTERNDDMVAGHFFDLTISSALGLESCFIPVASGNILDNNYIYANGYTIDLSAMSLTTQLFTAQTGATPITVSNTPNAIVGVFNGSGQHLTNTVDYTRSGSVITFLYTFEATNIIVTYQY